MALPDPPSLTLTAAVTLYREQFLAARNLAPLTRRSYGFDLADLLRYLTEQAQLTTVTQVERRHLEGYLASLDARHLKGSSRRRRVATIRSFFACLVQQGVLPHSPAEALVPPERERGQPRVLTAAEYKRLLETVRHETRDGAIIELLLQTGLRLAEVAHLTLADLELPARVRRPNATTGEPGSVGAVHVHGKGRKERTVTLNWKVCQALKAYLAVRPAVDDPHVFITKFGRGIGPRAIEQLVAKYLAEAGIAHASVHSLRHTFATHHARQGTPLGVIREALGHENLATTSLYVGLAREQMDAELQRHAL